MSLRLVRTFLSPQRILGALIKHEIHRGVSLTGSGLEIVTRKWTSWQLFGKSANAGEQQETKDTQSLSPCDDDSVFPLLKQSHDEKHKQKFMEAMVQLASSETVSLGLWARSLDTGGSLRTEQEPRYKVIRALAEELGHDANELELRNIDTFVKDMVAFKSDVTVEELDVFVTEFLRLSLVQRVLRKLRLEGKDFPKTAKEVGQVVKRENALLDEFLKRNATETFREKLESKATKKVFCLSDRAEELEQINRLILFPGIDFDVIFHSHLRKYNIVKALLGLASNDATDRDVESMSRLEKLRAANVAGTTEDEVTKFIHHFSRRCVEQKILRKQKLEGRPLPSTEEALVHLVSKESKKKSMMTKHQRYQYMKEVRDWNVKEIGMDKDYVDYRIHIKRRRWW